MREVANDVFLTISVTKIAIAVMRPVAESRQGALLLDKRLPRSHSESSLQ